MTDEQLVELAVVARRAGVRVALVRRYLQFGLFEAHAWPDRAPQTEPGEASRSKSGSDPQAEPDEGPRYHPSSAARVARAERLRRDLGLNYAGAVLACELLDRIRELESRQ